MCLRARIRLALSQAKRRAAMMTPTMTASARLCRKMVTSVTNTMTKMSDFGIRLKVRRLAHSKVPTATMIISPVKAAIGTSSIRLLPNMMNTRSITAATMPDSRARAPALILISDCPSMAHPPIPLRKPEQMLAMPCATASLFPRPRVSVISSMMFSVSRLSMSPTPATIKA